MLRTRGAGALLLLLGANRALGWDHSPASDVAMLLDAGEPVLVACKLLEIERSYSLAL